MRIQRLGPADAELAQRVFTLMNEVFEAEGEPLPPAYINELLARRDFFAMAALMGDEPVGGLTAHALPMTRQALHELFIYDIAVRNEHQRKGIGRALVESVRREAAASGIAVTFVPADNDDVHALEFYRALGGAPAAVTIFTFGEGEDESPGA